MQRQDVGILNVALGLEHKAINVGAQPTAEQRLDEYAKALGTSGLKSPNEVLDLAACQELGSANAYIGVIPSFADRQLAAFGCASWGRQVSSSARIYYLT